jgi:multidrug resistance efflux pump
MAHHPKRRPVMAQPRHRRILTIVAILMVLILAIYGYQFWWTE